MYAYAIRSIYTSDFYGFTRVKENVCVTKVPYFHNKRDAEKFASFLTHCTHTPQLYEYEDTGNPKEYVKDYCIYRLPDNFLRLMLGMSGIGYHECIINDDLVYCTDTGIMDVPSNVRGDVMESSYNRNIDVL
jgi:hypothetical protein